MSILLIASFGVLTFFLISQFGGKLTARNSLVWWLIFAFLGFGVVCPNGLQPLAHLLGIQLVSNFVLATMILFLAFQAIQESAFTTKQSRKLRDLVTSLAAEAFAKKYASPTLTPSKTRVLVGMPCFNEEEYLPTLEKEIRAFLASQNNSQNNSNVEYVFSIVNDGSTDSSRLLLDQTMQAFSTHHLSNIGVAGVLLTAFKAASLIGADYVVQCDSDGQHPLSAIPELVRNAKQADADLLIGSRYAGSRERDESSTVSRRAGARLIVWTLQILFGKSEVSDPTSGFRVYSKKAQRELLRSMPDEYPEPETIALLISAKLKVNETFVKMSPRQTGVSSLAGFAGARFMIKVLSALLGLRLRTIVARG